MEAEKLLWIFLLLTCHSCWGLINKAQEMEIRHEIRVLLAEGAGEGHPLMAGCARLLFHDAVGGGINGCINFDIDDNRGLETYISQLEKIDRSRWGISKADLWVLCAFESIHLGAILTPPDRVTRVKAMPHKLIFQQGRKDHPEPCPENELPGPNIDPVPFIMEKFPGYTIEDSVALMGAHTLGKAHLVASGYNNKWVQFPDWCDNEYYKDMIDRSKKWKQVPRFSPTDGSLLHQWVLSDTDSRLMLHCDMAMWMEVLVPEDTSSSMCGYPGNSPHACGSGPYVELVEKFAANNSLWLDAFCDAVMKLVALGHEDLQPVLP